MFGFYISTDNGESWKRPHDNTVCPDGKIVIIDNDIFVSTFNHGILLSSDKGKTWTESNKGLSSQDFLSLISYGNNLFAGSRGAGFFVSTDKGQNWSEKNLGLMNLNVETIAACGDYLFTGTWSGGVYRSKISEITDVREESQRLNNPDFVIYPNPADEMISVSFNGNKPLDGTIAIANSLGLEVKRFNTNELDGQTITIKTSGIPAGIYSCSFTSGSIIISRRFVIAR
jgi:hypothetical protein